MRILWNNLIDSGVITPLTEHPNYPGTNLRDQRLSRVWRSLALADQSITFDFSTAKQVSSLAIANHNFTTGATLTLEGNSIDSWGSPAVSESIVVSEGIITKFFAGASYRYWRLVMNDAGNPDGYLQIGRMFLGEFLQMPPISFDPRIPYVTTSKRTRSSSGQTYGDRGYRSYTPSFSFPFISEPERLEIEEMYGSVEHVKPVFLLIWEDSLSVFPALYATIAQENITWNRGADFHWATTIAFEEEK